jgi:tRNA(Ile)-lysidine synthase
VTGLDARFRERLGALEAALGRPARQVVAFSGGLDSTVLLRLLVTTAGPGTEVAAVHVDHQLHPDSRTWAEQAVRGAARLGVDCRVLSVTPDTGAGRGVEAAAREARYAALAGCLTSGDWLLSGHHQDDQVETLLLNLLRGSGPDGLAAMPESRPFAGGWLVRPLLAVSRAELAEYATEARLEWIEDPSNAERGYDRNFLRHEVLPVIGKRWPDAGVRMERSIERLKEASELLAALGRADLDSAAGSGVVDTACLAGLSAPRQRNALRVAIREAGLPLPSRDVLEALRTDLVSARDDAMPLVAWPGGEARRFRARLYLMPPLPPAPSASLPIDGDRLSLPAGLGELRLEPGADRGIDPALVEAGLTVRWRVGGERLKPGADRPTRTLKKLLQEASTLPWMRDRLPLLYVGDRLVAVADRFLAEDASASPGVRVRWLGHPPVK